MDLLVVVTALIGIFVTVIVYISKIFNDKSKASEIKEINEEAMPVVEKPRKKSESVRKLFVFMFRNNKRLTDSTLIFPLGHFEQKGRTQNISKGQEFRASLVCFQRCFNFSYLKNFQNKSSFLVSFFLTFC